jgi:hypothetical protein
MGNSSNSFKGQLTVRRNGRPVEKVPRVGITTIAVRRRE